MKKEQIQELFASNTWSEALVVLRNMNQLLEKYRREALRHYKNADRFSHADQKKQIRKLARALERQRLKLNIRKNISNQAKKRLLQVTTPQKLSSHLNSARRCDRPPKRLASPPVILEQQPIPPKPQSDDTPIKSTFCCPGSNVVEQSVSPPQSLSDDKATDFCLLQRDMYEGLIKEATRSQISFTLNKIFLFDTY